MALSFKFSENARSRLSLLLAIFSWLCIFSSLSLVVVGLFVKFKVEEYTNMVKDYDGDTVPYLLIAVGLIGALNNFVGGFFAHMTSNPLKRRKFIGPMLAYTMSTLVIGCCIFAAGIMTLLHIGHLEDSFHGGITRAMTLYKSQLHYKVELDQLQMNYECCGNRGYDDWFRVRWSKADYNKQSGKGKANDDVPFSCCSPHAQRPCIHNRVHQNNLHYNYDYRKKVTLHTTGCRDALMEYFGESLNWAGGIIIILFIGQVFLALITRFLQTSMAEAAKNIDDPLAPSIGYLLAPKKAKYKEPKEPKEPKNVDVEAAIDKHLDQEDGGDHFLGKEFNDNGSFDSDPVYQNMSPSKRSSKLSGGSKGSMRSSQRYMAIPQAPPPPPMPR